MKSNIKKTSPRVDNFVENQLLTYYSAKKKDLYMYYILALFQSTEVIVKRLDQNKWTVYISRIIRRIHKQ